MQVVQLNIVNLMCCIFFFQQGLVQPSGRNRPRIAIQGPQSLLGPRPQLQQGLLQQNVILNNNPGQRFQATIPHPQRQIGPNVRIGARPPSQKIAPKGVMPIGPRGQAALVPKQTVVKHAIPANCVRTSTMSVPIQPNPNFQPNSETVVLVSQPENSPLRAVPNTQASQLVYAVNTQTQLVMKPQQHLFVASPAAAVKSPKIVRVNKNQPGVITQPRLVTVRPPAPVANGVNIQQETVQAGQLAMEEGGEEEEEEEEEMEEEEEEEPPEGAQNCPTLAEEQHLHSVNQLNAGEICRLAVGDGKPFKVLWTGENFVNMSDKQSQAGSYPFIFALQLFQT